VDKVDKMCDFIINNTFFMEKPVFSIIIPTYNRCHLLWRAINSILSQTYPFFELLIIDDCSTDKTKELIDIYTDPRIKYFKLRENKGASHARNYALNKAKGKYIAYLDSDNEWHRDFLESYLKAFQDYPEKVVVFAKKNYRLKIVEKNGKEKVLRDETTNHGKYFDLKRLWQRKILIDTNTLVHKKEIIKKVGKWDEKMDFWEDWEFTLRMSQKYPEGFLYLNRALIDYEQKIDFSNPKKVIGNWNRNEKYIFNKHKKYPLIKFQDWYPPQKHKSTVSIVKFLMEKKKG